MNIADAIDTKPKENIIADIVGHPSAPCIEELDYTSPELDEEEIRHHLKTLEETGIVQVLELEPEERTRGHPSQFFEITDEARKQFDRNGRFPKGAWTRQYASVEKTDRIQELELIPRPEDTP